MTLTELVYAGIRKLDSKEVEQYTRWGWSAEAMACRGWQQQADLAWITQWCEMERGPYMSPEREALINLANTAQGYANALELAFDL